MYIWLKAVLVKNILRSLSFMKKLLFISVFFCLSVHAQEEIRRPIERNEPRDERENVLQKVEQRDKERLSERRTKRDYQNLDAAKAYSEREIKEAYKMAMAKIQADPCNGEALGTLLKIASVWSLKKRYREKALNIYMIADKCKPNNAEILFFLGRVLYWEGETKIAINKLWSSLEVDPHYTDSASLLITIYTNTGHYKQAECLLDKYPDLSDYAAKEAALAFRKREFELAECLYGNMVAKDPTDLDARRGLARSYAAQRKFKEAKQHYRILVDQNPKNQHDWNEYKTVQGYTDVSFFPEGSYTKAKEVDPDLSAYVVRDFYTLVGYRVYIPICNPWRLVVKQTVFHQKEDDIYPPMGINYNAYVYGASVKSEVLFAKYMRWDVTLRFLGARGYNNNVFYPFASTSRFEPGTTLVYSSPLQLGLLDAHVESFIIKNQDKQISQLLRQLYLTAGYILRPSLPMRPYFEVTFDEVFYHDDIRNRRNTENIWAKFDIFTKYLRFVYRFEHANFKQPTENYYSFKRQFRNTIGAVIHVDFLQRAYIEGEYWHRWEYTIGLDQPIGRFGFQIDKQRLQANKFIMKGGYRVRDFLMMEVAGHLFYDTLPYEDFNIRGSLYWQF